MFGLIYGINSWYRVKHLVDSKHTVYNQYFRIISRYMNQQSERDFSIRLYCIYYKTNTCMTVQEHCGKQVIFLVSYYLKDVKILLERVFSKYKSSRTSIDGPSLKGCSDGLIHYVVTRNKSWKINQFQLGRLLQPQHGQNKF